MWLGHVVDYLLTSEELVHQQAWYHHVCPVYDLRSTLYGSIYKVYGAKIKNFAGVSIYQNINCLTVLTQFFFTKVCILDIYQFAKLLLTDSFSTLNFCFYMNTPPQRWKKIDNVLHSIPKRQQSPKPFPDSKVRVANMGPTWVLADPGGPHVGPMNLAIKDGLPWCQLCRHWWQRPLGSLVNW